MRRRLATGLVGLIAGSLLLSGCDFDGAYDLPLPGSPVDADESYEVTASFRDILNVVPRSPVMVDDVTVGEVTEVERVGWHARVHLRIRDDVTLSDDVIAEIRQVSLLGEKYVALEEPEGVETSGRLGEGDDIPLDRTSRNPEVEEVLGALSFLLSGGGVAQLGTITRELNDVMSGRERRLRGLLGSLERFIGTLDQQKGDIISAMESLNDLTATLNRERGTIEDALDVTGPAIKVLDDQHGELIRMLGALDRLGVVGTRVIGASKDDFIAMLEDLRPVVANLRRAGDKLGPGLNLLVSFPFPKEASQVVQGDFANTSIRADISLENFLPDQPGGPGLPDLPVVGDVVDAVTRCLNSGSITSRACVRVLGSVNLLASLTQRCTTARNRDRPVCRALGDPVTGSDGGGTGGLPGGPGLPELPGLGRTAPSYGPTGDLAELFGGAA
jgi:phospholipid/cholesterol/gamma-HCH transport system substrate-binding protein